MNRRATVEAWITATGHAVGLGMIIVDTAVWVLTNGKTFEPLIAYVGLVLMGLGDIVGGVIGNLITARRGEPKP